MKTLRESRPSNLSGSPFESRPSIARGAFDEQAFLRMIAIERKRTERSKEPFLLMLLEDRGPDASETSVGVLEKIIDALLTSSRETDVIGWYKGGSIAGVLFTGIVEEEKTEVLNIILKKVTDLLREKLPFEATEHISISFHFYPDDWDHSKPGRPINSVLYPDLLQQDVKQKTMLFCKRVIDVVGSSMALLVCLPLLYLIGFAIKMTSEGPVLFKQRRVGQYGKRFTLLKFRSMKKGNDNSAHKEFVTRMIKSDDTLVPDEAQGEVVFKIVNDSRVTGIGKFLRKFSLDELPQFYNVLKGDMSLVGPRPPLLYELKAYEPWHRRRILDFKPGITGLWQVSARSSVAFDEMVRLDLQYAASWSPWLDIKILWRTPYVVVRGAGAH
jgi:lipopolysaccharide/colanic/teichoic acid biosynthesis glycosyltransferase